MAKSHKGWASVAETKFAIAFLKKLGGNYQSSLLIAGVIAWLRQESGGLNRVIGNNPFNIRNSNLAIGYRKSYRVVMKNGRRTVVSNGSSPSSRT